MMTGVSPIEHRILDFTRFAPGGGQKEPITSDERQRAGDLEHGELCRRTSATFGLWATYPAECVAGLLVSDRLDRLPVQGGEPAPGDRVPRRARELGARGARRGRERRPATPPSTSTCPGWPRPSTRAIDGAQKADPYAHPVSALRRILVETEVYHRLATDWIAKQQPDLAIVYLQGTDTIGHVFAPFAPPRQATRRGAGLRALLTRCRSASSATSTRSSATTARLAEERRAVLVIASDHGFFWEEGRPTQSSVALATAARWHRKDGVYLLWGPGIAPAPGHPHRGGATQVCATLLALARPAARARPRGAVLPGVHARRQGRGLRGALSARAPRRPAGDRERRGGRREAEGARLHRRRRGHSAPAGPARHPHGRLVQQRGAGAALRGQARRRRKARSRRRSSSTRTSARRSGT